MEIGLFVFGFTLFFFSSFQFKHNIVFNDTTMFCEKYKCFEHVGIKKL